jgi:F0F1-type ATP synthase membrane subunit b/b'
MKAEHAQARADRKAKIQARIDNLNTKLQEKLDQAKERSEQIKAETEAKVQALQEKAAKVQGDARKALEARVAQLRQEYEERSRRLKDLAAEQLTKAATQLKK